MASGLPSGRSDAVRKDLPATGPNTYYLHVSSVGRLAAAPRDRPRGLWIPRQHGAWAMLALPIVVGVANSRFDVAQVVLAGAALGAYLFSATAQAWLRSRRGATFVRSLAVYGIATLAAGIPLLVVEPRLLLAGLVVVPASALTLAGARPGSPRALATSLGQVAQASVLTPAAMLLAGEERLVPLAAAALVVAAEMAGSVLVVRSCIRERDNPRFAAASVGFHLALSALAAVALPAAYAWLGLLLSIRAAALPVVRGRRAASGRPIRPVHVGIVEAVASLGLVLVSFAVPLTGLG